MKRHQTVAAFSLMVVVLIGASAAARAATYSASGTHQCKSGDGTPHSCVVSGSVYSNCIDAASSLQVQDCCPSTQVCERKGETSQCRRGGTSTGFTMNYCIPGGF